MTLKKDRGRFTVRFDMENPDHVRAVEYLERQRDRGKAQYITQAILFYEKSENAPVSALDRALIEQIIQEYLNKQNATPKASPVPQKEAGIEPPVNLISDALAEFYR